MAGLSYRQVKDLYDTLRSSGATSVSLPEWSQQMNEMTGTELYSEGQNDNLLKRGSVAIDRVLEATGLPDLGRGLGRNVGSLVGNPEAGAEIGASLPRMTVNMLPYLIPGGGWAAAARLGGAALLTGAEAYTRTGSPASGIVSGGIAAAMPKATDLVEQAILKRLGVQPLTGSITRELATSPGGNINRLVTEQIKRYYPETGLQSAAAFSGGQLGASLLTEGQRWGEEGFAGEPLHNPFSTENLLNLTLGQLPFAGIHAANKLRGVASPKIQMQEAIAKTEKLMELKRVQDALADRTDIEAIPKVNQEMTPEALASVLERRTILRAKQDSITSKTELTPEDAEALNEAIAADNATPFIPTATSALGAEQGGEHVRVLGKQIHETAKWRRILVADDPSNPEELRGKVVEYSKGLREPEPVVMGEDSDLTAFGVTSDPLWRTVKTVEEEANRQAAYESARVARRQTSPTPEGPELPEQANPADKLFEHVSDLDRIEVDVDSAKTPAQVQKAVLALRALQERAGLSNFSDAQLKRIVAKLVEKGDKGDPVKKAVKARMARDKRMLDAQQRRQLETETAEDWYATEVGKGTESSVAPLLTEFKTFSEYVNSKTARGAALVSSGELTRMFHALKDDPEVMTRLKAQVEEVLRTGKGLRKATPVLDEVKKAVTNNEDGEPIRNVVAESALQAIQNKTARAQFEAWDRKNETNWDYEKRMFVDWVDEFGPPSKEDIADASEFFADRDGVEVTEIKSELQDFLERPHVKTWLETLEGLVSEGRRHAPQPQQLPPLDAGGGFVWGLAGYDPETNKLGGKHSLPKSSELTEQQFLSMAGRGKPLNKIELDVAKLIVPDAFDAKGNVNVRKLYKGLEGVKVVTSETYGMEGKQSEAKMELDKLTHDWFDNIPRYIQESIIAGESPRTIRRGLGDDNPWQEQVLTPEFHNNATRYRELLQQVSSEPLDTSPRATSYYRQISPFDTKKYPVVRVDVTTLSQERQFTFDEFKERWGDRFEEKDLRNEYDKLIKQGSLGMEKQELWSLDNLHENLPNTLGWAMVQFVPEKLIKGGDPNSEALVMFVGEQQSRWGQQVQKADALNKKLERGGQVDLYDPAIQNGPPSHPLLPIQHILVLKAAIAEAQKRGVAKMVISDGETAMMTEGHDKNINITPEVQQQLDQARRDGRLSINDYHEALAQARAEGRPSQEGGMRLHYDTTLPSAAKKLTGEEGERVEMGVHKNASTRSFRIDPITGERSVNHEELIGSPVFREASGAPKSSVTGRIYSLPSVDSFTLGDPSRAPQLKIPRTFSSDIPATQEMIGKLTTDGHGLIKELLADVDPDVVAIAKDLGTKFPEALSRIDSGVYDTPGSYAARRPAGRVGIFFDRSIPEMRPYARNNVVLHELLHGLTLHELANPRVDPKVVSDLTALRQRLVDALPKKLREVYDRAIASDWYARYTRGKADMNELHTEPQRLDHAMNQAQVIYGLLDNAELVSQGFTVRALQEYMHSVKGSGKGTNVWHTFTNWVRNLVGVGYNVKDTAFGDFLRINRQLMTHGEWLSDFANFGERYFEAQGKGGSYGRSQTQRALAIVAESTHGLDEPLTIATILDLWSNVTNPNLRRAKRTYENLIKNSPEDAMHVNNLLDESGVRDIDDLVTYALGEGQDISAALDLLPPEATTYIYEKLHDAKDVLDVIRAASADKNKGMVNLAEPALLQKSIMPVLKRLNQTLAHEEFATQMATDLAALSGVEPAGFLDSTIHMAPKIVDDFIEDTKATGGKIGSWFSRTLEPMAQWARRVPEVAEAVSKGFQLQANSRKMFHEGVKWLGMDTSSEYVDVLTKESVHQTESALANPKLADKIHQWMYLNNKKGGDKVQMLPPNDPDVAKLLGGLTDAEKATVQDVVNKGGKVTQMMNVQKLEKMNQIAAVNGAGLAGISSGLKTRDNVTLATKMLEGIQKSADPITAQDGMIALQNVQQRMNPEAFIELYDFMKGEATKIALWKKYFDENPFWATAQRTERFVIHALNKQGKAKLLQASTRKEAQDILDKKGYRLNPAKTEPIKDQWAGKEDEPFAFPNMSPEMAKRMQEVEANQLSMLSKVLSPEQLDEVRKTSAVTQILRESSAQQSIPGVSAPPRQLSQGAEEIPWMWNHISWAQREANFWSRQLLRAQARTYLKDVEIRDNPEMVERLKTHFENLLMPDPQVAQKVNRLASTWFLGYNPATVLINASQPFVTHVSELTSLTGKPIDSYRRVLNAMKEITGHFGGKKEWATKEHEDLMRDAVKDGEVGLGQYDDEAAAQESIATNFKRAMKKEAPKTTGERLGTLAGAYSTAGMWLFRHGEQVNARSALLAGFDYYREQGLSYKDAKEKAYEFNRAVNYGGGRAQRSVGLYSSRSPFLRGAAMLGTSLQSYVLGTTAQIVRHLQRGFFRPSGLTPHETYAARRAAIQMLATQFAAAGALGMPFVSGAIALLDKAFPELELNRKTRELVNSFFKEDDENGSTFTDIAMTGVPSMFGWDMQSRLSMGNSLPGVSEVNGFQPENLMGPTANIVRNFANGVSGWVKGDAKAGANFLPPPVRKLLEAANASLGGEGIRDYQGRPLAEPTPGESLGSFLGFQPKRLSDRNAAGRMLAQSEEVLRTQESRFRLSQAEEILKGNFGTVRQELISRKQANTKYDEIAAVQAIARASEELAFPRDLRREGTQPGSAKRSALLGTFEMGGKASEVERLQFRKMIEAKLGLRGDNTKEMQVAMLMDQLRLKDPNATRLELKSAALAAFRRASPRTLGSPAEFQ